MFTRLFVLAAVAVALVAGPGCRHKQCCGSSSASYAPPPPVPACSNCP